MFILCFNEKLTPVLKRQYCPKKIMFEVVEDETHSPVFQNSKMTMSLCVKLGVPQTSHPLLLPTPVSNNNKVRHIYTSL
jgi:hypothetical protein